MEVIETARPFVLFGINNLLINGDVKVDQIDNIAHLHKG